MIKTDKNLKYLYIILGFFIVIYILYIRIFLVRLPKDLQFNIADNYYSKTFFVLLSVFICIFIIINNLRLYLNSNITHNKLSDILMFFTKMLDNSFKELLIFITSFFENSYEIMSYIAKTFYEKFSPYPEYYLLFTQYILRFFITFIFLCDIFLYFKFNYFYKYLFLLCIVLLIKCFIYILRDFASNVEELKDILLIEDCGINEKTQLSIISYSLKPGHEDNDLNYLIEQFIICNKLSGYLHMYDLYSKFFTPRINIVIYSLYLIGWSYILFHNIFI